MGLFGSPIGSFPESITANNIVFHYTGQNYPVLDHAKREAQYTKREGYYVRVIKREIDMEYTQRRKDNGQSKTY